MIWSFDRVERVKQLADEGMSYQNAALQLTRELGETVTYSMMASLAKDMGIHFITRSCGKKDTGKWDEHIVSELRELIKQKYTGSQAAQRLTELFDSVYTKNAVIAACRKHKIAMGSRSRALRPKVAPVKAVHKKVIKEKKPVRISVGKIAPEMLHVPLYDLTRKQCAWPANCSVKGERPLNFEPCNVFCGLPSKGQFCEYHHEQASAK